VINSEFDTFASSLVETYELPEPTESIEEPSEHGSDTEEPTVESTEGPEQDEDDESDDEPVTEPSQNETASLLAKLRSENVTLEVAVDISEKTDQEILSIIDEIQHIAD
jgi:DNA-nicking Smr family endonuclease